MFWVKDYIIPFEAGLASCHCECPNRILDKLTKPYSQAEEEWREKCREHNKTLAKNTEMKRDSHKVSLKLRQPKKLAEKQHQQGNSIEM